MQITLASCAVRDGIIHETACHILQNKGLFGFFISGKDANGECTVRYMVMLEVAYSLATTSEIWMPVHQSSHMRQLGNAISVPQAALCIINGLNALSKGQPAVDPAEAICSVQCVEFLLEIL